MSKSSNDHTYAGIKEVLKGQYNHSFHKCTFHQHQGYLELLHQRERHFLHLTQDGITTMWQI